MSTNPDRQGVAVVVSGYTLLVAMVDIFEILPPIPCTEIPNVKPWFLGLASSSGNVIPVSDLGGFLFGDDQHDYENSRLLRIQSGADDFALRVDEVLGLRKFDTTQVSTTLTGIPATLMPFVNEIINTKEETPLPILVPELIVSSESFLNIQDFYN